MTFSKIVVKLMSQMHLEPGETVVGAVPLYGGDKMVIVTNVGRMLSVELEWY